MLREGALTNFPCRLRLKSFSPPWGVQVHPLHPLATTPMFILRAHSQFRRRESFLIVAYCGRAKSFLFVATRRRSTWRDHRSSCPVDARCYIAVVVVSLTGRCLRVPLSESPAFRRAEYQLRTWRPPHYRRLSAPLRRVLTVYGA